MNQDSINKILFETLDKIRPLSTAKGNMFGILDKYSYPPFLRFAFKDLAPQDTLYDIIKKRVTEFEGNCHWSMVRRVEESSNFVIMPSDFVPYADNEHFFDKNFWTNTFHLGEYEMMINKAIADIPNLAEHISKAFG